MKKFLTLVLALVMALAIAAPAMAFVSESDDVTPELTLDAYLVDYKSGYKLFNTDGYFVTLPETDRGYATNEMVAVLVEIEIPEDNEADKVALKVRGDNVRFYDYEIGGDYDTENWRKLNAYKTNQGWDSPSGNRVWNFTAGSLPDDDITLQYLFFARVVEDEASITVTLNEKAGVIDDLEKDGDVIVIDDYAVKYFVNYQSKGYDIYNIYDGDDAAKDDLIAQIIVNNDNYKSKYMLVTANKGADKYAVEAFRDGVKYYEAEYESGTSWLPAKLSANAASGTGLLAELDEIYEDVLVEVFGMDAGLLGNKVKPSYFGSLYEGAETEIVIDIKPFVAYVSIPDVEVIDPPKTGDAATLVGFVMILAALAGVVVFKKVRA